MRTITVPLAECSFCQKSHLEGAVLIGNGKCQRDQGKAAYICYKCVEECVALIDFMKKEKQE